MKPVTANDLSTMFIKLAKVLSDKEYNYCAIGSTNYYEFANLVIEVSRDSRAVVLANGLLTLNNMYKEAL